MELKIELENGFLPDRYGKHAAAEDRPSGAGSERSFPFELSGIPAGAKAAAWVFFDWDAIPVVGMPYMHWTAWLDLSQVELAEGSVLSLADDASRAGVPGLRQAYNSGHSAGGFAQGYAGPCPPDKDHIYTVYAFALDSVPADLEEPFYANELIGACRGHIIDQARFEFKSRA